MCEHKLATFGKAEGRNFFYCKDCGAYTPLCENVIDASLYWKHRLLIDDNFCRDFARSKKVLKLIDKQFKIISSLWYYLLPRIKGKSPSTVKDLWKRIHIIKRLLGRKSKTPKITKKPDDKILGNKLIVIKSNDTVDEAKTAKTVSVKIKRLDNGTLRILEF